MSPRALPLLLLAGCAHAQCPNCEPVGTAREAVIVCVDSQFGADEQAGIYDAVYEWNRALCGVVSLRPIPIAESPPPAWCTVSVLRVESSYEWVQAAGFDDASGMTSDVGGNLIWLVADRIQPGAWRAVTAHELGHALGLEHCESGLMAPRIGAGATVGQGDAVRAAYELGDR